MSDRAFLLALAAGQAILLAVGLGEHALWLDEVMSLNAVAGSWSAMGRFFQFLPEQHPFYYVLLRGWLVFGESELALRSLSAVIALASPPALFFLTRRLTDARVARIAAVLLATSPFFLYYGQEARMYSLLGLAAIVSSAALLRWLDSMRWQDGALYAVLCILGMYTHFFFLFLMFAHTLVVLAGRDWRVVGRVVGTQLLVGVAYLPWAWLIATNMRGGQDWKGVETVVFGIPYTFVRFSVGYAVILANFGWKSRVAQLLVEDAWILLPAAVIFGSLFVLGVRDALRRGPSGRIVLLGLFAPILASLVASVAIILVGERYYMVSFPFFLIVIALGLDVAWERRQRLVWRALPIAFGVLAVVGLGLYYGRPGFGKGQWREVVELIEADRADGERVLAVPRETVEPMRYYLRRMSRDSTAYIGAASPKAAAEAGASYWLVLTAEPDPVGFLRVFDADGAVESQRLFANESGVWVLRVTRAAR